MLVKFMCFFFFIFYFTVKMVGGELTATSTHQMRRVLEGEDHLLTDLRIYIKVVEQKLKNIRIIVDDALKRHEEAMMNPVEFVSNPLNSLPMLRRMHQDAPKLYSYLKLEEAKDLQQIADYRLDVLTDLDLEHAAKGLLRIKETYNLNERDMAKGLLSQKQYKAKLSTLDCVCLAKYLQKQGENQEAAKWLEIALEQYEETPEPVLKLMNTDRAVILRELGMIQIQRG
ncbi:prolyl 4-hydroxylase subunit alpha-1-like [Drosophila innubila]|uniref:prolyl 4-hydroxylase subunit alpha-1-like n=1 Tax=Drosophila innubila TaxID=198719 RepID=UPI00148DE889|nr:prolyl 4-hydroxylase subunit alpha-1-like [Drosophila innubila]